MFPHHVGGPAAEGSPPDHQKLCFLSTWHLPGASLAHLSASAALQGGSTSGWLRKESTQARAPQWVMDEGATWVHSLGRETRGQAPRGRHVLGRRPTEAGRAPARRRVRGAVPSPV